MLSWLSESSLTKARKAVLKQDSYEREMLDKIKSVESCAQAVFEHANICSQFVLGAVNQKADRRISTSLDTAQILAE